MASKIFISWGGELSRQLGEVIQKWLPNVLQFVKPYFTPEDTAKGVRWDTHLARELSDSNFGLICLTNDNINRPWILFEAGALSKNIDKTNVCTLLFDVDISNISGPLACFQATKFNKTDFKKLVKTINNANEENKLEASILDAAFDVWWPKLEIQVHDILANAKVEQHQIERTDREVLEEILNLTRMYTRFTDCKNGATYHILMQLLKAIKTQLVKHHNTDIANWIYKELLPIIKKLCAEQGYMSLFTSFNTEMKELEELL